MKCITCINGCLNSCFNLDVWSTSECANVFRQLHRIPGTRYLYRYYICTRKYGVQPHTVFSPVRFTISGGVWGDHEFGHSIYLYAFACGSSGFPIAQRLFHSQGTGMGRVSPRCAPECG